MVRELNSNSMMTRGKINSFLEAICRFFNQIFNLILRVLYFSLHRYDYGKFWPNLRESDFDYIGEKEGKGYNINIPLNEVSI